MSRIIALSRPTHKHAYLNVKGVPFYKSPDDVEEDGIFIGPERLFSFCGVKHPSEFRKRMSFQEIIETAREMYEKSILSIASDKKFDDLRFQEDPFYVLVSTFEESSEETSFYAVSRMRRIHGTGLKEFLPTRTYKDVHLAMPIVYAIMSCRDIFDEAR